MGIAKRLYARRHYGGDLRLRGGKPYDASLGARPRCTWCLRGEEAGPVVEDLDGRRLHDECRAELAARRGETLATPPAPSPAAPPSPPSPLLPVPSEGREHLVHAACGGAGCPQCRHTGYATMGPLAIARLIEGRADPAPAPAPAPAPTPGPSAQLTFAFGD